VNDAIDALRLELQGEVPLPEELEVDRELLSDQPKN